MGCQKVALPQFLKQTSPLVAVLVQGDLDCDETVDRSVASSQTVPKQDRHATMMLDVVRHDTNAELTLHSFHTGDTKEGKTAGQK